MRDQRRPAASSWKQQRVGIPVFVDTGLNLVHVDDVASGHLAALRSGKIGARYILGGENVLFSQMLKDIAGIVGRQAPWMKLPWCALVPVALVAEGMAAITGREPFATLDGLYMARDRMFFTSTKAERELSYHFRPYIQGIRRRRALVSCSGTSEFLLVVELLLEVRVGCNQTFCYLRNSKANRPVATRPDSTTSAKSNAISEPSFNLSSGRCNKFARPTFQVQRKKALRKRCHQTRHHRSVSSFCLCSWSPPCESGARSEPSGNFRYYQTLERIERAGAIGR